MCFKNIHKLNSSRGLWYGSIAPHFFYKNQMTMSKERKIIQYAIDEKTYKSLEIQFKREYVYNMVFSKILAQLKKM